MEAKPVISLIGSAIHTNLWLEFYESLRGNVTSFEVVLVGDKRPHFVLPDNFRFIYSTVKPVQCVEIACRHARGDFVMVVADDILFSRSALDKMYDKWREIRDDNVIISSRWSKKGKDLAGKMNYFIGDANSPLLPCSALIKKKLWQDLGGVDRRFIASCADLDIALRIYEIGGRIILCDDVWVDERKKKGEMLYPTYGAKFDRPLLDSFWVKDGRVMPHRLVSPEPLNDSHLLTITQGAKGKWGSDPLSKISRRFSDQKKRFIKNIYHLAAFVRKG